MAGEKFTIQIQSILGGISPNQSFASDGQIGYSEGITPYHIVSGSYDSQGFIIPTLQGSIAGTTEYEPVAIFDNPKDSRTMIVTSNGSTYAFDNSLEEISDGGSLSGASFARGEYYDNYIYVSKDTTIARYGPLDGTPAFDGNYWVGTLGMAQLYSDIPHLLCRHSDGRLYITDVVDGKGTLHFIQTTKTTVEGDTNNGSEYNAVQVGYNLFPSAICSLGSDLVIGFNESNPQHQSRAKIAFWDTLSQNVNSIVWTEFPVAYVMELCNNHGVLYAYGESWFDGGYLYRYIGGNTFERIPLPVRLDSSANNPASRTNMMSVSADKLYFAQYDSGTLFSLDRNGSVFIPLKTSGIYAIAPNANANGLPYIIACSDGISGFYHIVQFDSYAIGDYGPAGHILYPEFVSEKFRIGRPFKITKVRIPLYVEIADDDILSAVKLAFHLHTDGVDTSPQYSFTPTYWPEFVADGDAVSSMKNFVWRPENAVGKNDFRLIVEFNNSNVSSVATSPAYTVVRLPITIEGEYLDD